MENGPNVDMRSDTYMDMTKKIMPTENGGHEYISRMERRETSSGFTDDDADDDDDFNIIT